MVISILADLNKSKAKLRPRELGSLRLIEARDSLLSRRAAEPPGRPSAVPPEPPYCL